MHRFSKWLAAPLLLLAAAGAGAQADNLAGNTVLIIRHSEKPESKGDPGLTEMGRHRAEAYIRYFRPFHEDGLNLTPTALYAGADDKGSNRPRLTLEPLSRASGMPLDTTVGTKDPEAMVTLLRTHPHGTVPLISWRHGQMGPLLAAFGAHPDQLLPGGKWPDETFDWVLVLRFDGAGKLISEKRFRETLEVR